MGVQEKMHMPGRLIPREEVDKYLQEQARREQTAEQDKSSTADTVAKWVRNKERPKAASPQQQFRSLFKKNEQQEEE